ncbi:hypothetical protein D3C71_1627870 [compost metagenome]
MKASTEVARATGQRHAQLGIFVNLTAHAELLKRKKKNLKSGLAEQRLRTGVAPVDIAWQVKRVLFQGPLVNQRADHVETVLRQSTTVLGHGVDFQRQAIEQVVIVETAQMQVALHQLVLIQVAQHPFQQTTGGGK